MSKTEDLKQQALDYHQQHPPGRFQTLQKWVLPEPHLGLATDQVILAAQGAPTEILLKPAKGAQKAGKEGDVAELFFAQSGA